MDSMSVIACPSAASMSTAGCLEIAKVQDARRSEVLNGIKPARLFFGIKKIPIPGGFVRVYHRSRMQLPPERRRKVDTLHVRH